MLSLPPLVSVQNTSFSYPNAASSYALSQISLEIAAGEFVAVLGANGSGKSTLAKLLNALLLPTSGKVVIAGMDTADDSHTWEIRKTIGMVFQNPENQIVATVVEEDVAFGVENLGLSQPEIRSRVDAALAAVGMAAHAKSQPHLLSGGQKQRIAIAGVIAMKPQLIVFDEATSMLDPIGRSEIRAVMQQLHKDGMSLLLITHYMEEAQLADRVVLMSEGCIISEGSPREILCRADLLQQLNLEAPWAAELGFRLHAKGLIKRSDILYAEELVEAICR